ncbi:MAG: ATP-binding protein [Paludibacteraceae bacterium]|nr:ATP-binding protein [Paludibacteraceae bacterium]
MGRFLDRGNADFARVRNSEYVDKSAMIQFINETLDTEYAFSCVSRCRRFGKSLAAKMLYAYYDRASDSRHLFEDLAIAKLPSYEQHLNKYPTIFVDMTRFTTDFRGNNDVVNIMQQTIKEEICDLYPDIKVKDSDNLMDTLFRVADGTGDRFIMIIDEWDAICREFDSVSGVMDKYVDWLRCMFKSDATSKVFLGVYMTGILPIKKYNTQSALNNFREYSMIDPDVLAPYFGFTEQEVVDLATKHNADIDALRMWYDGYKIGDEPSMYNPYSVMEAIRRKKCKSYWQTTGAYDMVVTYIQMNFEGLKDDIIRMLAGDSIDVNTTMFNNDMKVIECKDDVLTVLIHLGYLSYDEDAKTCRIPNKEVAEQFENAIRKTSWKEMIKVIENSKKLLEATLNGEEQVVAAAIDMAHDEQTSILTYNNENSLACVLAVAYIWAKEEYVIHREYASGKGFADLVMIPRKNVNKPALVIELKYNTAVDTAIDQILNRNYPEKIKEYTDNLLLVGISYDRETKQHICKIERA